MQSDITKIKMDRQERKKRTEEKMKEIKKGKLRNKMVNGKNAKRDN